MHKRLGPWYYGCIGTHSGHTLWDKSGQHITYYHARDLLMLPLDGGYLPNPDHANKDRERYQIQGLAKVTHEGDTTILAFWDRTVDHRYGSHSTFVLPGIYNFKDAVITARKSFPVIWERFDKHKLTVTTE